MSNLCLALGLAALLPMAHAQKLANPFFALASCGRLAIGLAGFQPAAGFHPAAHSGKPQTEYRAEFYDADDLRGGITRRRGGRMPPRMGAWQPGRLRYGAA